MDPIPILTGPTAVGKTELGHRIASEIDAEIISADSRQVYRELNVGTAKPDERALQQVPHHFINERSLVEPYSAGIFQREAYLRIEEIHARGHAVLVVGGSTLYVRALKVGLAQIPDVPREVRSSVMRRLETEGASVLYEELQSIDPRAAESLDPTKTQRLVRAIEVYQATGKPLSSYHAQQSLPDYAFRTVVLWRDRHMLYDRINRRVDAMLARGLVDEVRSLLAADFDLSINPLRTIGYNEALSFLRDEVSHEEMRRLIKRNTRRYAKRQLTWFRRDEENVWIDAAQDPETLREQVLAVFRA